MRCKIPHIFRNDEWAQIEERMLPLRECNSVTWIICTLFVQQYTLKIPIIIYISSPLKSTLVQRMHENCKGQRDQD